MRLIFWLSALGILYTYLVYPCLIAVLARLRARPVLRRAIRPRVSLVISAYNESQQIERRLRNCLALDYPKDRLEILVASDGSADATAEIARRYEAEGVTVLAFETRRGKPSVLNDVIPKCAGEIVLLGDTRQIYDSNALIALVRNFADPAVGAVSGELVLGSESTPVGKGVGFYWRYEKFLRRHESRFDSTVGATGAIYAIRRDLFRVIPADTLLDDVLIPMRIVRQGYRVVFEPEAKAFDRVPSSSKEEFTRKVRTIAGNLQLFARERWVWSVRRNRVWFQLLSHKLLRILGPFLLGGAFVSAMFLASSPIYRLLFAAQVLFYAAALAGLFFSEARGVGRWLSIPYAFCLLNATTLVSIFSYFRGGQTITWRKASDFSQPAEPVGFEPGESRG